MQKIAIGLSALPPIMAATAPGAAQDAPTGVAESPAECAEYVGCLDYGTLSDAQAGMCRGHPQFAEVESAAVATANTRQAEATPDRTGQASRVIAPIATGMNLRSKGHTVMTTLQASLPSAEGETLAVSGPSLGARLGALKSHLVAWARTCADYYRAAALYDELSRLSDAELHRRGLSRATLAWDICNARDRTNS